MPGDGAYTLWCTGERAQGPGSARRRPVAPHEWTTDDPRQGGQGASKSWWKDPDNPARKQKGAFRTNEVWGV